MTYRKEYYQRWRAKRPLGAVIWEGESLMDGAPIVVIANGLRTQKSQQNRKIGNMVQTWILRRDLGPYDTLKGGQDASICGSCKMRPGAGGSGRACYVQVWPYVNTIWSAYQRGVYWPLSKFEESPFHGRYLRIGAYGDPSAVPFEVWENVLQGAQGWTAYTHAWRTCDPRLQSIAMASVDTPAEYEEAMKLGWRTFRTRLPNELVGTNEIMCPASKEGGQKLQCIDCNLCSGTALGGKNITILPHGSGFGHYLRLRRQSTLPVVQHA